MRKAEIQEWVSGLTVGDKEAMPPWPAKGATTVIRAHRVLASILDGAVDDRRALNNPTRGVNLPRKTKKTHIYLLIRAGAFAGGRIKIRDPHSCAGILWTALGRGGGVAGQAPEHALTPDKR